MRRTPGRRGATDINREGDDAREIHLVVDEGGARLDRYLADHAPGQSRSHLHRLIGQGRVTVDGVVQSAASFRVGKGQRIAVDLPEPAALEVLPEAIPLDVLYEDDDLLVVNKAPGMVVHPAPGHRSGTLVAAILGRGVVLSGIGGVARPGIVHRIDKDTSGVLVIAKNDLAHAGLAEQFREHSMERVYEAIVHGAPGADKGTVDAPIGRDPRDRLRMAVVPEQLGRHAVTHFVVRERLGAYSHLDLRLETGRTHQIRVHMAYIGHPVAGDPVYARRNPLALPGQALHARSLGFAHPRTGLRMTFAAPLPDAMEDALMRLRRQQ